MTQGNEPQIDNVLIPRPISVHSLPADKYPQRFRADIIRSLISVGVVLSAVWAYFAWRGGDMWWIAPVVGTVICRPARGYVALSRAATGPG